MRGLSVDAILRAGYTIRQASLAAVRNSGPCAVFSQLLLPISEFARNELIQGLRTIERHALGEDAIEGATARFVLHRDFALVQTRRVGIDKTMQAVGCAGLGVVHRVGSQQIRAVAQLIGCVLAAMRVVVIQASLQCVSLDVLAIGRLAGRQGRGLQRQGSKGDNPQWGMYANHGRPL
ncbi:hypothetical protein XAC2852_580142 [Xanthomonas citri pv. citri]|nr:hypothetical protein XAC2852_580142 [Xanthomonas citri pv. citri]